MDVPLKYARTLQSLAEVKLPSYLKIVGNFKRFYFQQTLCCSLRLVRFKTFMLEHSYTYSIHI